MTAAAAAAATRRRAHTSTQRTFLWIAQDRVLPVVMHTRRVLTPLLTDLAIQRVLAVVHDLLLDKLRQPVRDLLAQPAETVAADGVVVNCYFDRPARPTSIVVPTGHHRFQSLRVHAAELHLVVVPSDPRPPPRAGPDKTAPSTATKRAWSIEDSLLQLVPPVRAAADTASDANEVHDDDDFTAVYGTGGGARASKRTAGPASARAAVSSAPSAQPWSSTTTGLSAGARTQLAAELHEILPHLRAIVAGTAVSWRRDAFFGTGRSRAQLRDQFGYAGIASEEGEALVELLMDWFVGDEPENMQSVALVTDVLVPEAIVRLLMTRRHVGYADAERLVAAAGFARPNVQS